MALEVQAQVLVVDTVDGERVYSATRSETVVPARLMQHGPDPDAIVPLLKAASTRLADECRDKVLEQLDEGAALVEREFGE